MSIPKPYKRVVNPEWLVCWRAAHGAMHRFSFCEDYVTPEPYIMIGA